MTHILYPSQLEGQLKALRLPGMAKALSTRLKQAESGKLSHAELVGLLCEDEVNARADTKREKLFKSAKLPSAKGLEPTLSTPFEIIGLIDTDEITLSNNFKKLRHRLLNVG